MSPDVDGRRRREGEVGDRDRLIRRQDRRDGDQGEDRRHHRETDRPPLAPRMADPPLHRIHHAPRDALPLDVRPRVAGRFSCGAGVSSPSHDGDATSRQPRARARPRAGRAWDGRPGPLGGLLGPASRRSTRSASRTGSTRSSAFDQEGLEAVGARPRDPNDGSDHARGEGHARQGPGAVRQGDAAAARGPDDPLASRRSASTRRSSPRPRTHSRARASRSPRSRRASRPARRSATSRSPRRGRRSQRAPTRSTWSSTAGRSSRATS